MSPSRSWQRSGTGTEPMRTSRHRPTFRRRAAVGVAVGVLLVVPQADPAAPARSASAAPSTSTGPSASTAPSASAAPSPSAAVSAAGSSVATSSALPAESPGLTASPEGSETPSGGEPTATASARGAASALAADGIPSTALQAYQQAAAARPATCHITWPLIAAIGRVESHHGTFAGSVLHTDGRSTPPIIGIALDGVRAALIRDTDAGRLDGDPVYDRAVGPMQFIPSTWQSYATDSDGDGRSDPFDIYDAAAATAKYLCAAGGDLSSVAGQRRAVLAYNHSDSYVATVLTLAATYAGAPAPELPTTTPEPLPTVPPANPAPPPAVPEALTPSSTTQTQTPQSSEAATAAAPSTTPPPAAPPPTPPPAPPPWSTPPSATPPSATPPPTTTSPPSTTPPPSAAPQ